MTLGWSPPASDGGSPVTGYVVTPFVAGVAQPSLAYPSTATVETVTGLADGTTYDFTVAATNAVGLGAPSTASPDVTPATVPGAPGGLSVLGGDGQVTLGWSPPASDGGSPVTGYVVTPFVAGVAQPSLAYPSTATVETVTGLADGTTYDFTVAATNAVGLGAPSTASPDATPVGPPGPPSGVAATSGDSSVTVTWSPPASDGGSSVTGYVVTPYVAGVAQPSQDVGNVGSVGVDNLTNGVAYTFTVAAVNTLGQGADSAASDPVTPATVPGAPSGLSVLGGDGQVTLGWSPPASDGGSPVTGYVVTPYVSGVAQPSLVYPSTATVETVTGLADGTTYDFTVAATNAVGLGAPSPASPDVTPATVPGAPSGLSVLGGDGQVTLGWSPPASDGGSPVTGYVVTPFVAGVAQPSLAYPSTATVETVTGLADGTTYDFTVAATNAVGLGAPSTASPDVTPATVPGAPSGLSVLGGDGQVTLGWSPPASDGGSPVTGYVVTPFVAGRGPAVARVRLDGHGRDGDRSGGRHHLRLHRRRHQRGGSRRPVDRVPGRHPGHRARCPERALGPGR